VARSRNIKPGFFLNEDLAECSCHARLLFIGLWCLADREGRLEDRAKRIKASIFPYENVDVDSLLTELESSSFLVRYIVDGKRFVQIKNFLKHQNPHYKEVASEIPAPQGFSNVESTLSQSQVNVDSSSGQRCTLIPDSLNLIPDSRFPHTVKEDPCGEDVEKDKPDLSEKAKIMKAQIEKAFNEQFWPQYPRKIAKREALKAFEKLFPLKYTPDDCNRVLKNIGVYLANLKAEKRPIDKTPYPATFLNREDFDSTPDPIETDEIEFVEVEA